MEEEEVVLGLIPAADWVENRPLKEGGDIELAAAKKLQHCKEAQETLKIKPKKEKEDDIEEITLDSEEEGGEEIEIKQEEALNIEADAPFQDRDEGADTAFQEGKQPCCARHHYENFVEGLSNSCKDDEIETKEEKHHIAAPIVFSAGEEGGNMKMKQEEELQIEAPDKFPEAQEDGEMKMKQEEELQIEAFTEFPEAEENDEVNMYEEEEMPHIEAVTVFSDSDEGETIEMKEEEELQIEPVTVYSDYEVGEEDSEVDQMNKRYNMQENVDVPFTLSLLPLEGTVIETPVQDVFGCNTCPMSFGNTGELSKHVRCHPPRKKPFCCRICLKTDTLAANLKRHMRTHSGEKPYSCILCSKMFTSAYSLKIHKRIHSGYKPYVCNKCPKAFYQKTDLNKHSIVHFRSEETLQGQEDLPENRDVNPLKQNVKVRNPSAAKVYSRGAKLRASHNPSRANHYMLPAQSSLLTANRNSNTSDSVNVNSQNESPYNALHCTPAPFAPIITEVVGSFHDEDSEMQPCPSKSNNRGLQRQVAFLPRILARNQIRMEKPAYTQPVTSSANIQGSTTENTSALHVAAAHASSSGGEHFGVNKSSYSQSKMYSVSSQNEANSVSNILSPVQLSTNVMQNNASSPVAAPNTTFVNNLMPKQPGGETFCIPLIVNGQVCYAIPASTPSQLSVVSNPASVQTSLQPVTSHSVHGQETYLLPVFMPPIANGVQNPNSPQPLTTPAVTPSTLVVGNAAPIQSQHQIGFQTAPITTVARVQPENSSGSQMENVSSVQQENSLGSEMATVKTVLRGRINHQFMLPPPPAVLDVESLQRQNYHEHRNHHLTFLTKSSSNSTCYERVFCNTCKAPVTVFTKRAKQKKVS